MIFCTSQTSKNIFCTIKNILRRNKQSIKLVLRNIGYEKD